MALDKQQLARMLSVIAAKENTGNLAQAPLREVDPNEYNAEYKSGAVLQALYPILNVELEKKNPQKYRELMSTLASLGEGMKSQLEKVQSGKMPISEWSEYAKGEKLKRTKTIEDFDFPESLSPEELKKVLGPKRFNDYVSALAIARKGQFDRGHNVGGIVGDIENPQNMDEIRYGKRLATQPSVSGIERSGRNPYAVFYDYNPDTGEITVSPRSYGVDMKTGVPIVK